MLSRFIKLNGGAAKFLLEPKWVNVCEGTCSSIIGASVPHGPAVAAGRLQYGGQIHRPNL